MYEIYTSVQYMSPYMTYLRLRFPVPLNKGNEGSGDEIAITQAVCVTNSTNMHGYNLVPRVSFLTLTLTPRAILFKII